MERFRPNIVVKDLAAFEEDNLGKICFNDAELYGVKPCARCIVTTLDPETNKFSKNRFKPYQRFENLVIKFCLGKTWLFIK